MLCRTVLAAILLTGVLGLACHADRTPLESTTSPDESRSMLKSKAWKNYQTTWRRIDALKDSDAVDSLFDRIDAQESDLDALFPDDTGLVNDLLMIIRDKLSNTEKMLREQRGRPSKPDWISLLKRNTARLAAECRVFQRFSTMAIDDPWISDALLPDMRLFSEMVAQGIADVRSHTPLEAGADDIRSLLRDADAMLTSARAVLEEVGM
jgi:hypothetical protein